MIAAFDAAGGPRENNLGHFDEPRSGWARVSGGLDAHA
jgi:hypothetical protein